jgi:hypothetical protein
MSNKNNNAAKKTEETEVKNEAETVTEGNDALAENEKSAATTASDEVEAEVDFPQLQANAKKLIADAQKLGVNVVAFIKEESGLA